MGGCCTTDSNCRLETNRPFASFSLGRAGCFGGFGLSGWILTNRPVFGPLGGTRLVGFCGWAIGGGTCPLS